MEQDENRRQQAMDVAYKLGYYGIRYCVACGYSIEDYQDIKKGLCIECQERYED